MAQPTEELRGGVFYHGTDTTEAAKSIWKNGLDPQKTEIKYEKNKGNTFKPVTNKVYITKDAGYAAIYAIGGDLASSGYQVKPTEDRYGYLLEFDGSQLNDVQPDEDSVGEFISIGLNSQSQYYIEKFKHIIDSPLVKRLVTYTINNYSPSTVRRVKDGEALWETKLGKLIVKILSDSEKLELIKLGAHIAHEGKLVPNKMYRIDKKQIKLIKRDYSNFFEIAKLIKER